MTLPWPEKVAYRLVTFVPGNVRTYYLLRTIHHLVREGNKRLNYPLPITGSLSKEFEANSDEIYQPLHHARLSIHLTDSPKAFPGKLFTILYDRLIIPTW